MSDAAEIKKITGRRAVDQLVTNGMKLGMGTGSTAIEALKRLDEKLKEESITEIYVVPTSLQTEIACREYNIPLWSLNDPQIGGLLDLTIDGADEVDPEWNLIKGGGGAQLVEKILAYYSRSYAIIVDESKIVETLGANYPIPVEVLQPAILPVTIELEKLGARVTLRQGLRQVGPVITRHGNLILDITLPRPFAPHIMEQTINHIPGVVENGLFTLQVTDLFIGNKDGSVTHKQKNSI